jgi:hypothetical protein
MRLMRRSSRRSAVLASAPALLAVLGLVALPGCKKDKAADKGDESANGAKSTETPTTAETARKAGKDRFKREGLSARLGLEPITVDEVKPLTPELTGAKALGEPVQTAGGRRVTAMQCLDGTDVEKIRGEIEAQLGKLGFATIRSSPKGKRDLVTLSADKPPFRFSATVRTGPYPDCPAEQKKVKVLMSWFKRAPRPRPGSPTAPGMTPMAPDTTPATPRATPPTKVEPAAGAPADQPPHGGVHGKAPPPTGKPAAE